MARGIIRSASFKGRITKRERNQTIVAASTFAGGSIAVGLFRNPRNVIRAWKFGASTLASATELKGVLPALGRRHKLAVRYGSAGTTTIGQTRLGNMYMGGMPEANLPIPTFGFGLTSVPNTGSRLVNESSSGSRSFTTQTERVTSRGGRGATTLSQRASRSVRPGKRRRRCKSRNKSGKTCLRPRSHSGRHRYR